MHGVKYIIIRNANTEKIESLLPKQTVNRPTKWKSLMKTYGWDILA